MLEPVCIIGVGSTVFGRHPDQSLKALAAEAAGAALADANIAPTAVEAAYFANSTQGYFEGQHAIRGPIALRSIGFEGASVVSVESACAGGAAALHQAILSVRSGSAEVAIAVGAEKMWRPSEKARMLGAFDSGWDIHEVEANLAELAKIAPSLAHVSNDPGGRARSVFMDIYAAFCEFHMATFGTTREQLAAVAAKNHQHSVHNRLAQHRRAYSVSEVLAAPTVAGALTVPMCSSVSDGAAAVIVAARSAVQRLGISPQRVVTVRACRLQTGISRAPSDYQRHIGRLTALAAYELAGVDPADIDVAEVHDATAMGEIIQSENLGFCEFGDGGRIAEAGETRLGGRIPINLSGGLESKGHPVGATGLSQIFELVLQLRGEACQRQHPGARLALAENGGGLIGVEEAVCAVTILEAASAA